MPVTEADLAPGQNVERLTCSICSDLFQDPVFAEGKCQCVFCRSCITANLKRRPECPLCKKELDLQSLKPHLWVGNALGDLLVTCPNQCEWIGTYDSRAGHLTDCPVTQVDKELKQVDERLEAIEKERVHLQQERRRLQEKRGQLRQGPKRQANMSDQAFKEILRLREALAARTKELAELREMPRPVEPQPAELPGPYVSWDDPCAWRAFDKGKGKPLAKGKLGKGELGKGKKGDGKKGVGKKGLYEEYDRFDRWADEIDSDGTSVGEC